MTDTTKAASLAEQLAELARDQWDRYSPWQGPTEGPRYRVKLTADSDTDPFREYDCYGTLHWPGHGDRQRPASCDGSAVKLDSRDGPVWWQPPADVKSDPAIVQDVRARVQSYLHDEWSYLVLWVERQAPACKCCGESATDYTACGGVESDAGAEHWAELIGDMIADLEPKAVAATPPQ